MTGRRAQGRASESYGFDAFSPKEIAARVDNVGLAKVGLPLLGALGLAPLVSLSAHPNMNGGAVGAEYVRIAGVKTALPFWAAFFTATILLVWNLNAWVSIFSACTVRVPGVEGDVCDCV